MKRALIIYAIMFLLTALIPLIALYYSQRAAAPNPLL